MNKLNRKIKFAVIGFGHIGKRHAEMIVRNQEAELVAIVDVKPADELNVLEKYNVSLFQSIEGLLAEVLGELPEDASPAPFGQIVQIVQSERRHMPGQVQPPATV